MSKFAHEAAQTRKRVRDSSASEEESISQKIKISSVVKKTVKSVATDATESDEVTSSVKIGRAHV